MNFAEFEAYNSDKPFPEHIARMGKCGKAGEEARLGRRQAAEELNNTNAVGPATESVYCRRAERDEGGRLREWLCAVNSQLLNGIDQGEDAPDALWSLRDELLGEALWVGGEDWTDRLRGIEQKVTPGMQPDNRITVAPGEGDFALVGQRIPVLLLFRGALWLRWGTISSTSMGGPGEGTTEITIEEGR